MGLSGIDSSLKKEQIKQFAVKMPKDKIQIFETTHRAKDGISFPVEVWSSLVTYQGKKAILSIARDITERKKTEELIKREKQLLRVLIDNLPDAIYIKDKEGRKLIANKADLRIMQRSSEDEVVGKTDLELFDKVNGEKGYSEDMAVIKTGQPLINHEDNYTDIDGKLHYRLTTKVPFYDANGEIAGLVGFGHDITERKQAEKELAWEQYLMHSLLDNIPDSIYFKDTESRFLRINKALAKKFGLDDPILAIGKSDTDFFKSEHANEAYNDEQKIIETGNPIIAKEEIEVWADKPSTWISTTKMPLTNSKGEIIGTFGISRDIDEQKRTEEELIKAKEKAEESDKLKTAFLHNISHEIRTPMNAIIGFSELLYDRQLEEEKRDHYLDLIRQSSNQLLLIINDIVNISTIEAGQLKAIMKEFNLNRKLQSVYRQFESEARNKGIELIIEPGLSDDESVIITDETKLVQICINLVNNGIKFTKSGHVRLGYSVKDHSLEFYVEDTGIGIRSDMHEKIFERFRQADLTTTREYGGTGLGLTIAKAYINLLGGRIWLTSEPGKGTTFYFTIPGDVMKKPTVEHIEPASGVVEGDQPKVILVVEDEELNYMLIEEYLSGQKVSLLRAKNGIEAIEYCRNYKSINLVLMDIKMPKMDGYEATRQIRTFNKTIPIIALTAHTQSEDMDNAIRAGCDMFISKPVKQNELIALISNY
jgi:PAS domain S-box-containing protein